MRRFVDTNIFIRLLTRDEPKAAERCFWLFKQVEDKKMILETSESVLAEVVYILSSKRLYNLSPTRVYELLLPLISLPGLKMVGKRVFLKALEIYVKSGVDFEDALSVALMRQRKIKELYSYDKDFDRLGVRRLEP